MKMSVIDILDDLKTSDQGCGGNNNLHGYEQTSNGKSVPGLAVACPQPPMSMSKCIKRIEPDLEHAPGCQKFKEEKKLENDINVVVKTCNNSTEISHMAHVQAGVEWRFWSVSERFKDQV